MHAENSLLMHPFVLRDLTAIVTKRNAWSSKSPFIFRFARVSQSEHIRPRRFHAVITTRLQTLICSSLIGHRNEKDSQGENMFMRCVSELVIESREVRNVNSLKEEWISALVSHFCQCLTLSLVRYASRKTRKGWKQKGGHVFYIHGNTRFIISLL